MGRAGREAAGRGEREIGLGRGSVRAALAGAGGWGGRGGRGDRDLRVPSPDSGFSGFSYLDKVGYNSPHGMQGLHDIRVGARRAAALWLCAVLCALPIVPLAAFAQPQSSRCSCCHGRTQCCCRKAKGQGPSVPALSARTCSPNCGIPGPGSLIAASFVAAPSASFAAPPARLHNGLGPRAASAIRLFACALRQRPPPSSLS